MRVTRGHQAQMVETGLQARTIACALTDCTRTHSFACADGYPRSFSQACGAPMHRCASSWTGSIGTRWWTRRPRSSQLPSAPA
eukprot:1197834-Prymnesium_polylepis.1